MIDNEKGLEILSLPLLLISLPLTVMGVLMPMYTSALGLTPLQVTGLFSVFSFGLVMIHLFIGHITDNFGRKPVFLLGLLFYALSFFIYSNANTILIIYIGRSMQAIASAFVSISSYSMIADLNMKDNAHSFGKVDSYSEKGGLIGVILCFFILNTPKLVDGWSRLFIVCTIASIIAIIYSLITLRETKISRNISSSSLHLPHNKKNIIKINLMIHIFTSVIISTFVLYLQNRFNSNLLEMGAAFLLPTVIIAFALPGLGRISDNIGSHKSYIVSLNMLIISLLILPFSTNIHLFGVTWTVYCIGITLLDLTLNSSYIQGIGEEIRGIAIGRLTMGANIGRIIGPIIGGFAFQAINIKAPYIISAVGFVILFIIIMKDKQLKRI